MCSSISARKLCYISIDRSLKCEIINEKNVTIICRLWLEKRDKLKE